MIPGFLKAEVERKLKTHAGAETIIAKSFPVTGGCINSCFRLQTSTGDYFLKYNSAGRYPQMFEEEVTGLELLRKANSISIPETIAFGEINEISFLLLEWIEGGKRIKNFWNDFGSKLAALHRGTADCFGLEADNYIGSLVQSNRRHQTWSDFFIRERLEPQIKLAMDKGAISTELVKQFNILFVKLEKILPLEKPALLHGDLWSGNFLVNTKGEATVVDPAVHYGHREMDLSMTKLFGGFDPEFYAAYNNAFPLEKGYESRVDIHNLYPLMVHVNLFGGGYVEQVKTVLRKFC